ncbi:ABC transporter substrate-binding protein, partial [Pseudonocardia sp. KRD-169]|nr:ABC transporter substrate-binding protein [Pseudonocardia abyssalis]
SGNWTVDGQPVALVIGSAAERPEDGRVARLVAAQLTVAGIDTTAVESPAAELFVQGSAPATEITATTAPATTSSAAPATSSAAPTTAPPPGGGVAVDVIVGPRTVGGAPGTELASDYGCALPTAVVPDPPSTPTGFCFPALQLLLESLAAGSGEDDPARFATAERVLWMQLPALPLFQPVGLVVSSAAADAATGIAPGPLTEGPLAGAARWNEPAR